MRLGLFSLIAILQFSLFSLAHHRSRIELAHTARSAILARSRAHSTSRSLRALLVLSSSSSISASASISAGVLSLGDSPLFFFSAASLKSILFSCPLLAAAGSLSLLFVSLSLCPSLSFSLSLLFCFLARSFTAPSLCCSSLSTKVKRTALLKCPFSQWHPQVRLPHGA